MRETECGTEPVLGPLELATATGLQLANRLNVLAAAAERNVIPMHTGRRLALRLDRYEAEIRQLFALRRLVDAIDPEHRMPLKPLARAVKASLLRAGRVRRGTPDYRVRLALELLATGFKPDYCPDHLARMIAGI